MMHISALSSVRSTAVLVIMLFLVTTDMNDSTGVHAFSTTVGKSSISHTSRTATQLSLSFYPQQQHQRQQQQQYSREIRLREEAESPFRKVRGFLYLNLLAGASVSLTVSCMRIAAAALSGINTDTLDDSIINAGVDTLGLITVSLLYKRDNEARETRLRRASKGANLAQLQIRGSAALLSGSSSSRRRNAVQPLSRGIEKKRIVIAIASREKIASVLRDMPQHGKDLVIVPVVCPQYTAPLGMMELDQHILDTCVALPAGGNWRSVLEDETRAAREQGIDVETEGVCLILKSDGLGVGQRTRGIFLERMVQSAA